MGSLFGFGVSMPGISTNLWFGALFQLWAQIYGPLVKPSLNPRSMMTRRVRTVERAALDPVGEHRRRAWGRRNPHARGDYPVGTFLCGIPGELVVDLSGRRDRLCPLAGHLCLFPP